MMSIEFWKNDIKELNRLIYTCAKLLDLKKPYVNYFIFEINSFQMYDLNLNIISYDKRDADVSSKTKVRFIKKENSIYINLNYFEDSTMLKILTIRAIRGAFQYKQALLYSNNKPIKILQHKAEEWKYCFEPPLGKCEYYPTTPIELDKNAFASLLMSVVYKIGIRYDFETNFSSKFEVYNEILFNLEEDYPQDIIKSIYLSS